MLHKVGGARRAYERLKQFESYFFLLKLGLCGMIGIRGLISGYKIRYDFPPWQSAARFCLYLMGSPITFDFSLHRNITAYAAAAELKWSRRRADMGNGAAGLGT